MINDELYIDGEKVDLGEESNIYIEYRNNFLGDITKIEGSFTYTIKIPKTAVNMRLCGVVTETSISKFVQQKHKAMLLRNGFPVVRDASVYISSVTDEEIEFILVFGASEGIQDLVNTTKNLNDLNVNETDKVIWERVLADSHVADYGFGLEDINAWYHPVVSVGKVMQLIEQTFNCSINIPDDVKEWQIPLLKRNGIVTDVYRLSFDEEVGGNVPFVVKDNNSVVNNPLKGLTSIMMLGNNIPNFAEFKSYGLSGYSSFNLLYPLYINTKATISGEFTAVYTAEESTSDMTLYACLVERTHPNGGDDIVYKVLGTVKPITINTQGGISTARFYFADVELEETIATKYNGVYGGNFIAFCLPTNVDATVANAMKVEGYIDIKSTNRVNTREYGANLVSGTPYASKDGEYYFVPNLPEISVIDFIKGICIMAGLYVKVDNSAITLMRRDDIDLQPPFEWLRKKLAVKNITFNIDGIAQRNVYQYKDGDKFSGVILVDNDKLQYEREIEVPFAEPKIGNNYNLVFDLYDYNDEGEQEFTASEEMYIVKSTPTTDYNLLNIDGLRWSQLLDAYYNVYKRIIQQGFVVTSEYILDAKALQELDLDKRLYDNGAMWVIDSVKTRKGNRSEVKLIKL